MVIGRLPRVDLAAVAAFTAAVLSLISVVVNVVLSYRMSSRTDLEQWRWNEERPIVARLLTLSDDIFEKWLAGNDARMDWIRSLHPDMSQGCEDTEARDKAIEHWRVGSELYEKIGFEVAQLDLIAGHTLREAAGALVRAHWGVMYMNAPQADRSDWFEDLAEQLDRIAGLRKDLVLRARADLAVDRGSGHDRLRSAWRRFRARRKLTRLKAAYPALIIEPSAKPRGFVAVERATGRRIVLAKTIESMEQLLAERALARERGESPGLVQELYAPSGTSPGRSGPFGAVRLTRRAGDP